jgi:hypothetical protein
MGHQLATQPAQVFIESNFNKNSLQPPVPALDAKPFSLRIFVVFLAAIAAASSFASGACVLKILVGAPQDNFIAKPVIEGAENVNVSLVVRNVTTGQGVPGATVVFEKDRNGTLIPMADQGGGGYSFAYRENAIGMHQFGINASLAGCSSDTATRSYSYAETKIPVIPDFGILLLPAVAACAVAVLRIVGKGNRHSRKR